MSPVISVIMTTYNEDKDNFIKCIDSVLNQTYKAFELILVFEPGDVNLEFITTHTSKDDRVKIIANKEKMGFVKSLNIGISYATGKYMARIDSDDFCELSRFEKQVKYLEAHPNIDVLGTNLTLIDKYNNVISKRKYKTDHKGIKKSFLFTTGVAHPSIMLRMEVLQKFGAYNEEFTCSEDLELWLRLIRNKCLFANIDEHLVNYRVLDIEESRNELHWKFNFKARFKHVPYLWNPIYASVSIMAFKVFSMLSVQTRSQLAGSKLLSGLKGKKEIKIETNN
ncbi:MAG: glycosyltransferase [Winogradskyella sp.]|uniref:glycosyltransferase n=1 Tax=Winogradskyella sp. TaxID=1883156 RepID=UPI00385D202A